MNVIQASAHIAAFFTPQGWWLPLLPIEAFLVPLYLTVRRRRQQRLTRR